MKSANGVVVLILGILSLTGFGCLTGIPAWIMGNAALRDIDAGLSDPNERGMVVAGRLLGMIATCLAILLVCLWLFFVVGIFGLAAFGASQSKG